MNLEAILRHAEDGIEPDDEKVIEALDDLDLFAHPVRRRIVDHLARDELTTAELAEAVGIERNNLYHHLERLVEGGIVALSREVEVGHMTVRHYRAVAERFVIDVELPRAPSTAPDPAGGGSGDPRV